MSINQNDRTNEELVALIQGGENEKENMFRLWQQNTGFINRLARQYSADAEMEDLEQEGYIGLCEAAYNYDPDRGMSFINYATFWLRRGMRACADNSRAVRIPFGVRDEVKQYQKIIREYLQEYGCTPSDRELCGLLYVNLDKLNQIKKAEQMSNIRSLSEPISGMSEDVTLEDVAESGVDVEEDTIGEIDKEWMKKELWLAVDQLPGNLPYAVRLRYKDGLTLEKTGGVLGVNREKARQIESKAMRILRQPHRCRIFRAYFEEYLSAAPIHHISLQSFKTTWWSETERLAIK